MPLYKKAVNYFVVIGSDYTPDNFLFDEEFMENLRNFARIFKSMGDPIRLSILRVISKKPICVSMIASELKITNPLASHHLKILEREELVTRQKEGVRVRYQLNKKGLDKFIIRIYKYLGIEMELENIPKFLKTIKNVGDFLTDSPKL